MTKPKQTSYRQLLRWTLPATLFAITVLWVTVVTPQLLAIPSRWTYQADVFSEDNFFDQQKLEFKGPQVSRTTFSYRTTGRQGNVLDVVNLFDVRQLTGEPIISIERRYGVNRLTGQHVVGHGDRDRDGYLFAPRHLDRQDITYWHVNYDAPARLSFRGQERLAGLTVYRYQSQYQADQTANLTSLPGVGQERGINLDVGLKVWFEPLTGQMVKYEDAAEAWYYDRRTGQRLVPWNKFHNQFTQASIDDQVRRAKKARLQQLIVEVMVPLGLVALSVGSVIALARRPRPRRRR